MSDIVISVSFPYASAEEREATVTPVTSVGSIYQRALLLFKDYVVDVEYDIVIELIDGTYIFGDLNKPITAFNIPEKPKICLVPHQVDVKFTTSEKEITYHVDLKDTVDTIKEKLSKELPSISADGFVLYANNEVLFDALSLPEQCPGIVEFSLLSADDEKAKIDFMDLYLRGPVYLPLSDAYQLSAYLLQAYKGPSRCFNGSISSLVKFLPERFQDISGAAADVHLEWSFLSKVTRTQARKDFTEKVQFLPLFNCTSFTGGRVSTDKSGLLPEKFEIVFSQRRLIVLDYIKFKTRISINYDDVLKVVRKGTRELVIHHLSADGTTKMQFSFNCPTARSFFKKVIATILGEAAMEEYGNNEMCRFRKKKDIEADTTRPPVFPEDFLYQFITMDESEPRFTNADLMNALLIRADACAWHLSVLLEKVNENNAKVMRPEITAYFTRLMAYLKFLTYDHRPYDAAYEIGRLLCVLETKFERTREVIQEVLSYLAIVKRSFLPISKDPVFVTSRAVTAYVFSHYISLSELPFATPERDVDSFAGLCQTFLDNGLALKDLIQKYLFSVGDVDLKLRLQKNLDFIFKHHLSSLVTFRKITDSSPFKDLDPSIILHQDSCNTMMTSMTEFSRVLWEDRKALPDEVLKEFLEQAAEIARQALEEENNNSTIVSTLSDFAKVIALNLPGLIGVHRQMFTMVLPAIDALKESFRRAHTFTSSQTVFDLIRIVALLIIDQPEALQEEAMKVTMLIEGTCDHVYSLFISDAEMFELDTDEAADINKCALSRFVVSRMERDTSGMSPPQILEVLSPALALQHILGRAVSEYIAIFLKFFTLYNWFCHALAARALYEVKHAAEEETLSISENTKEALSNVKYLTAMTYLIPSDLKVYIDAGLKALVADPSLEEHPMTPIAQLILEKQYGIPEFKDLSRPERARILVESICAMAEVCVNPLAMSLLADPQRSMLVFHQAFGAIMFVTRMLRKMSKVSGFFEVPRYWLESRVFVYNLIAQATQLFETCVPPATMHGEITSFMNFSTTLGRIVEEIDLTVMYPVEQFEVPEPLNVTGAGDRRYDLASIMSEYRVMKNELVECIVLREKENSEATVANINVTCQELIYLVNYVCPEAGLAPRIAEGMAHLEKMAPRLWTYQLSQLHIRDALEPVDAAIDEAIDAVSQKMYEPVTVDALKAAIQRTIEEDFPLEDRKVFIHKFATLLKREVDANKDIEEEADLYSELLNLLRDNALLELKRSSEAMSNNNVLEECIDNCPYARMVVAIDDAVELLETSNIFVWYAKGVKEIALEAKKEPYSEKTVEAFQCFTNGINSSIVANEDALEIVRDNIDQARPLLQQSEAMELLDDACRGAVAAIPQITQQFQQLTEQVLKNTAFSGNSLIYKDSILQIVASFYKEFLTQDWPVEKFAEVCQIAAAPLPSDYSSSHLSEALLRIRRVLRAVRLHNETAHPRFITDTERTLNQLELALRQAFGSAEAKQQARISKQRAFIDGYVERLAKVRPGQVKTFVIRLIQNLALDINSYQNSSFEADSLSRSIVHLCDGLQSPSKAAHVSAVIHWVEGVERGVLPVDVDELLVILRRIEATLKRSEGGLFAYDESELVTIAMGLSTALSQLAKIRDSLSLVKNMHKMFPLKDPLTNFIVTILRSLEAYADEIHIFRAVSHPVLGMIKSVPSMCIKLEQLIECAFMLTPNVSRLAQESADKISEFVSSCPGDLVDTARVEAEEPIKLLLQLAEETKPEIE